MELHKSWLAATPIFFSTIAFFFLFLLLVVFLVIDPGNIIAPFLERLEAIRSMRKLVFIVFGYFVIDFIFIGWLDYYLDMVVVTNERIVFVTQNALFSRKISELNMEQIQDVTSNVQGFFPTFFNFGEVLIQTAGERENFSLTGMAGAHFIAQRIMQARRDCMARKISEQSDKMSGAIKEGQEETKKKIGEMLLEENLITQQQLARALAQQKKSGGRLGSNLVGLGYLQGQDLAKALGEQSRCPSIVLSRYEIDPEVIKILPRNIAHKFMAVPISKDGSTLTVAMADPWDAYAQSKIAEATGLEISPVVDAEKFIKKALDKYYPLIVDEGRIIDEQDGIFWQGGKEMPNDVGQALNEMQDDEKT